MNLEQQFTAKLVSSLERTQQFVEHVTDGFLRADVEKRGSFYVQAVSNGWMTINEVRERENLPPLDGDDVARVPMNTEALEAAPSADEDDLVEPQGRKARRRRFASLSSTTTTTPSRSNSAPTPCCPRCAPGSPTSDPTRAPPLPPMRWCGQHFADQKRQLMKIADMERGEVYELSLSKVCIRRETSGADELADHLLQHGLTKDGKLAISPPPLPGAQPPRGMSIKWLERCHKHRCRSTGHGDRGNP